MMADETTPNESKSCDATVAVSKDHVTAKRSLLAVNFFVETSRLEPYVAVYLVEGIGWKKLDFGIVSLVMNVVMVIFQTPAGDLLDKSGSGKKMITALAIVLAAITTTMVVWTSNFWLILVGKAFEGIASTIFLPALMSLLLGISQTDAEVPTLVANTEVANKIGSFLIVSSCAIITYVTYPRIDSMFYLLGAGGLAAAFFTMAIPDKSIDHDRARQLDDEDSTSQENTKEFAVVVADGSAEDVDDEKFAVSLENVSWQELVVPVETSNTSRDTDEEISAGSSPTKTKKKSKSTPSRYLDLFKNKDIIGFAILTFTYHLANAGTVPLLSQHVAAITSDQAIMTWTSAILIAGFLPQALTAYLIGLAVKKYNHKSIMMVAFVTVPLRCLVIALLIEYFDNPWALTATQIFDGTGAGVYDTMIPILVQRMVKGSGRYGFVFGFICSMWRIGHGASVFVGEALVQSYGYTAAFRSLGALGLVNMIVFGWLFRLPEAAPKTPKRPSSAG